MADTSSPAKQGNPAIDARASAFVAARLGGRALPAYPGQMPGTLEEAYAVQADAIRAWPDTLAGWKVGRINSPHDAQLGTDRLAGPIFSNQISQAGSAPSTVLLFENGFGAIEGEVVIEAAADAPAGKRDWTLEEALEIAGKARLGVEVASSPFPGINDHGPLVTVSDFGNNNGLILGEEIPGWRTASPADWRFQTSIDGALVGTADASSIPGGPLESFRAVLEICARRGMPLRRGDQISTGAVTGVHVIGAGQSAVIRMAGLAPIACNARLAPQSKAPSGQA